MLHTSAYPCESGAPAPPDIPVPPRPTGGSSGAVLAAARGVSFPVYIVEPDRIARIAMARDLAAAGFETRSFPTAGDLEAAFPELAPGCVIVDIAALASDAGKLSDAGGADPLRFPTILLFSSLSTRDAVAAVRLGAVDLLQGPVPVPELVEALGRAAPRVLAFAQHVAAQSAKAAIATLRPRELYVLECIMKGFTNKEIARTLGISPRTVEMHRTRLHRRLRAGSLAELLALAWRARSFSHA